MIKIYHNNRCRKSREALQYLEKNGIEKQIIEYLKNPLSAAEWKNLFSQIDKQPQDMIRIQEALWKSDYKGQEIDDTKLLELTKSDLEELAEEHPGLFRELELSVSSRTQS